MMRLNDDLTSAKWIYIKGFLFLLVGVMAAIGLLIAMPTLQTAALLATTVWAFCRFYYFMFYVIEKYVDGNYRFAGISSFVRYLLRNRR
jgi:hypothetical protein